jgi:hypothetical protein
MLTSLTATCCLEKLHDYEIEPEQLQMKEKQLGTSGYFTSGSFDMIVVLSLD